MSKLKSRNIGGLEKKEKINEINRRVETHVIN
jgi:hypothetical protein